MEKKEIYNIIKQYKNIIYGVDKGFEYLDSLIFELKKSESEITSSNIITIYDYKLDKYFAIDSKNINTRLQEFYLDFVFRNQILKATSFNKVYNNLVAKLKTTNIVVLNNYSVIVKLFFLLLKEMTLNQSVLENKLSKSEFLKKIVNIMDKCVLNNTNVNTEMANLILSIFVEEKILKESFFSISLIDLNLFSSMKYMRNQMVDVFSGCQFSIKYSTNYSLLNLSKIIFSYVNNVNLDVYNNLLQILSLEEGVNLEEIRVFVLDFNQIEIFPKNILIKNNKAIALFERIHLNKLILNEYCFNVIAISCFENYFFSKEKVGNILLQKTDPRLNLNHNIYEVFI